MPIARKREIVFICGLFLVVAKSYIWGSLKLNTNLADVYLSKSLRKDTIKEWKAQHLQEKILLLGPEGPVNQGRNIAVSYRLRKTSYTWWEALY